MGRQRVLMENITIKVTYLGCLKISIIKRLEYEFNQLGRTEKCEFISQHIELASSKAIAKYVKEYLFDVLKDVGDDEYIATYLRNKGYKVEGISTTTQN